MRIILAVLLSLLVSTAFASDRCKDSKEFKDYVAKHDGQWITLTTNQFNFLRGVFAIHPDTPAGLPFGEGAVLAKIGEGGMAFFTDGDKICDAFSAPKQLQDLLNDLENPHHEGQDN